MPTRERLKAWLIAANLSRAEFARRIEYDRSNLNQLLRGRIRPTIDLAVRIERVTDGVIPAAAWADQEREAA